MTAGPARVLEALRSAGGDPCSGETLRVLLGVSRAQIWKHVEALRRRGYSIEGAPGGGYRLLGAPDRLFPEELASGLETRWLAREIHHFESVDSTNRVAFELGRAGHGHGAAVVAESQTAGRGRLGRSFFSPAHLNLYTSILLRPDLTIADAPTLILAAAIGVAEAVATAVDDDDAVTIKWPNDVQLGGLKTCGILMEMNAEATRVGFAVLGIGVNLNVAREDFPEDFRKLATSLRAHAGAPVDRAAFTRRLYRTLEQVFDEHAKGGFASLRPRFERRFHMAAQSVRVREVGGGELSGTVRGIDADGALLVERHGGPVERVLAGDVTLAGEGPSR